MKSRGIIDHTTKTGMRWPMQRTDIDIKLAVMTTHRKPGQVFNLSEIARVCEVKPQTIHYIEQRALRRLRHRAYTNPIIRELLSTRG